MNGERIDVLFSRDVFPCPTFISTPCWTASFNPSFPLNPHFDSGGTFLLPKDLDAPPSGRRDPASEAFLGMGRPLTRCPFPHRWPTRDGSRPGGCTPSSAPTQGGPLTSIHFSHACHASFRGYFGRVIASPKILDLSWPDLTFGLPKRPKPRQENQRTDRLRERPRNQMLLRCLDIFNQKEATFCVKGQ